MDNIDIQTSLLALAGNARLPPKILFKEKKVDDTDSLISMEIAIQEFIKNTTNFNKLLHNNEEKKKILNKIIDTINNFEFDIKESYIKLWEAFISGKYDESILKPYLDNVISKINNKKIKSQVESSVRTKFDKVIKTILNITPPFVSIFRYESFEKLSKSEQLIQTNINRLNETHTSKLDTFLDIFNYVNDEEMALKQYYSEISQITSSDIRNDYYNKLYTVICNILLTRVGKELKLTVDYNLVVERIFVQMYLYMITVEPIKKIEPIVEQYLKLKSFDWFSYQINNFTNKLHPNWSFKPKRFVFDQWQKDTIVAIDNKKNIFLSLPTSGGKTIISTYAIRINQRICYLVPSEALAYQLTGIILASLNDIEKTGETSRNVRQETENFSFKKFPEHADDIVIATPIEFYNLLKNKTIDPKFDTIIIDEMHNITDSKLGIYIEYIIKFATYYKIPIMCLSATIPNHLEVNAWLEKLIGDKIFMVNERKRFFNQTRMTIKNNKLVTLNPLEHLTNEILKRSDFTHIGLYPKEIVSLYNNVLASEHPINEKTADLVTLDKLDKMERDIFTYLKNQDDSNLEKILNNNIKDKEDINTSDSLTIYKLFKILRECKVTRITPALIFKMDSQKCLDIYYKMLSMLRNYQTLVYGDFAGVNKIIQLFLDTEKAYSDNLEIDKKKDKKTDKTPGEKSEKANNPITLEDHKEQIRVNLFKSVRLQLEEFFRNYINEKIDPLEISRFNTTYGADITLEFIVNTRNKHATNELKCYNSPDNLFLKNPFTPHSDCRLIDTGASYDDMKKIRRRINAEIKRENILESNKNKHKPLITYSDPFMIGIEYGIICNNKLLSSALQRACQQLINEHPFITFTDDSLAVGINYPIKTVMLLGGLDNEPFEDIDNTLAHQACGRAGRRGLDSEGFIIYAGVNIKKILIPSYTPIVRNPIEKLSTLFCDHDSEQFKKYMTDEIRPDKDEDLWKTSSIIDIDKLANEMYLLQTNFIYNESHVDDDEGSVKKISASNKMKSLEEIKEELILRYTTKVKVKVLNENNNYLQNNQIYGLSEEVEIIPQTIEIDCGSYDNWEDAADAVDEENNNNNKLKETIKNVESSFM
jgi:hypothetical protein